MERLLDSIFAPANRIARGLFKFSKKYLNGGRLSGQAFLCLETVRDDLKSSLMEGNRYDDPSQVITVVNALDNITNVKSPQEASLALVSVSDLIAALMENRSNQWSNLTRIMAVTDLYLKSASFVLTQRAANNSGWDARNILAQAGWWVNSLMPTSHSMVQKKRAKMVAERASDSVEELKLVATAFVSTAQASMVGGRLPSLLTSGDGLNGYIEIRCGRTGILGSTYNSNQPVAFTAPYGLRVLTEDRTIASVYSRVNDYSLTLVNSSPNYYGVMHVRAIFGYVADNTGVYDTTGMQTQVLMNGSPKDVYVAYVSWTTPGGTTVFHRYPDLGITSDRLMRFNFSVNVVGGAPLEVRIRIVADNPIADAVANQPQEWFSIMDADIDWYPIVVDTIPVQSTSAVELKTQQRYDELLGSGYMNCGSTNLSLGGCAQAERPGNYMTKLLAQNFDEVNSGSGIPSLSNKYVPFNANLTDNFKVFTPGLWGHLLWGSADSVRRAVVNQICDEGWLNASLNSTTFFNNFTARQFSSTYTFS